jgi:hypothetical protein
MPDKIRQLDRARIHLSGAVLDQVTNLARLAGVTCSDIVNYVLSEVLADDAQPEVPDAARSRIPGRTRRRTRPADVIPISRRERAGTPASMTMSDLRRRAAGTREHARQVRARAVSACQAAGRARERASAILHGAVIT